MLINNFFVDFQNFWRQYFEILSIHNPSLSHVRSHKKFGSDRFSRFDVYLIQQTSKNIDRLLWCFTVRVILIIFLALIIFVFLGFVINGLVNVVITSIERRFGLQSTQTGLIASSYDIGIYFNVCTLCFFFFFYFS